MNQTLYNKLNMKAKNSIFKSVFITTEKTCEDYNIVTVEPYDDTFLNAIKTQAKYDKTVDKIMKKVYETLGECWLIFYTDYGHCEYLINDFYLKEWGLI